MGLNLTTTAEITLGQVAEPADMASTTLWTRMKEMERDMLHLERLVAAALLAALMQVQAPALAATDAESGKGDKATGQAKPVSMVEQHRAKAAKGNAESQYALALAHAAGLEVNHDIKAAVGWFKKAAGQGHMESQYELGVIYAEGTGKISKDNGQAADWFKQAAQRGHPQAQWRLSLLFENGQGVRKNLIEAYKWASVAITTTGRGSQLWRDGSSRLYRLRWKVPSKEFAEVEKWVLAWRAPKPKKK